MNILIIKASNGSEFNAYKGYMSSPPQGIFSLAAATPEDHHFEIIDETVGDKVPSNPNRHFDLAVIFASTPDIIKAYTLTAQLQQSGLKVVLAGLHVTFLPNEAAQHADSVIIGEAELVWPQLLDDLAAGQLKSSYKSCEQIDLANLQPWPCTKSLQAKYGEWGILVGRGCRHSCSYCTVRPFFKREAFRPITHIIDEIKASKAKHFELHADNLCADHDYAMALFAELKKLKIHWSGEATLDFAENEQLLKAAADSGLWYLVVGLETKSHIALKKAGKGFIKPERAKALIQRLHGHNIIVDSCLLFGFDEHEQEIFDETIDFIDEIKLDVMHPNFITPFPGSKFYNQLLREGRLTSKDWADYDCNHVVFEPKNMTAEQLERGVEKVWRKLSSTSRRLSRLGRITSMQGLAIAMSVA